MALRIAEKLRWAVALTVIWHRPASPPVSSSSSSSPSAKVERRRRSRRAEGHPKASGGIERTSRFARCSSLATGSAGRSGLAKCVRPRLPPSASSLALGSSAASARCLAEDTRRRQGASLCAPPPDRWRRPRHRDVRREGHRVNRLPIGTPNRHGKMVLSQIWCSVGPSEATFWRSSWEVADDEQNGAGAISTRRFEDGTDRGLREHGGRACSRIERQIGVPALRSDLRSPAQQISEAAGRPSRSWSRRQDRSVGPAAPLPHTALPYTSVRGAVSAVGYAPAWPADLAVAGAGAPPRPGVGRTPGASPRGPPIAAGEQRHVPARRPCLVQRFRRRSAA